MPRTLLHLIYFILGYSIAFTIHNTSVGDAFLNLSKRFLPDKKWNWCPLEVTKLMVIKTSQEISDPAVVTDMCQASMTHILPVATKGNFRAILRAQNVKGQVSFLEYDPALNLFRIESQVFSSKSFEVKIKKYVGQE